MNGEEMEESSGRFRRSWQLMQSSWHVLKLEKGLITLPLIQAVIIVILSAVAVVAYIATLASTKGLESGGNNLASVISYIPLVIFIVATTFVANIMAGAIIYAAFERFDGKDPTVGGSLRAAWSKRWPLFKFSLLAAGVGMILDAIRERVPFAGKVLTFFGDAAWAVASFFALPIIIREAQEVGPIEATKKSAALIRRVWGESLVVSAGIGIMSLIIIFAYTMLSVAIGVVLAAIHGVVAIVFGVLAVIGLFIVAAALTALSAIAKAAVYHWATTGEAPVSFNQNLLRAAMTHKKARGIFGA